MSNYSQVTFFAPKDALITGNPLKLIKGSEVDPEFLAISTAIATKANSSGDTIFFGDGSAGSPSITFALDTNTGIYRFTVDSIGFTAGGTLRGGVDSGGFFAQTGSAGAPSYSFDGDHNTGMFRFAADTLDFAVNGVSTLRVVAGSIQSLTSVQFLAANGTALLPSYSFSGDPDTGMFSLADGALRFAANGTQIFAFNSTGQGLFIDGAVGSPSQSFLNDSDTGFYRDTANQIAIALGGAAAGQIAQGSFSITLSGCTTAPSVTATYQRIGNIVILNIPAVTATSNAVTCTLTGLPAIITPATTREVAGPMHLTNAGADLSSNGHSRVNTSSVVELGFSGVYNTWTNSGSKGIGSGTVTIVYSI